MTSKFKRYPPKQYPKERSSYNNMKNRVLRDPYYEGVTICERWLEPGKGWEAFMDDMGPQWQAGLSLDRLDNTQGYSPSNCRWATRSEQNRNRKSLKRGARGRFANNKKHRPKGYRNTPVLSGENL